MQTLMLTTLIRYQLIQTAKHFCLPMIYALICGTWEFLIRVSVRLPFVSMTFFPVNLVDIVDIKPANMEELTEVITATEFHPHQCNLFMFSSSRGTIKLGDMRMAALCDQHAKST